MDGSNTTVHTGFGIYGPFEASKSINNMATVLQAAAKATPVSAEKIESMNMKGRKITIFFLCVSKINLLGTS